MHKNFDHRKKYGQLESPDKGGSTVFYLFPGSRRFRLFKDSANAGKELSKKEKQDNIIMVLSCYIL